MVWIVKKLMSLVLKSKQTRTELKYFFNGLIEEEEEEEEEEDNFPVDSFRVSQWIIWRRRKNTALSSERIKCDWWNQKN